MSKVKTLYARFADIGMGETLEDGVDLGKVTSTLEKVGVQVLNAEGKMNSVGDIMEDLMDVWGALDTTQKNAIATTLAGKYQLSRFEALMNRSDLYDSYKSSSEDAEGTLDIMNEKYIDSLAGKMNTLQAATEGVMNSFVESDSFYSLLDVLTQIANVFSDFVDAIGGGGQALLAFGSIATQVFQKDIAQSLYKIQENRQLRNRNKDNIDFLKGKANDQLEGKGIDVNDTTFLTKDEINNYANSSAKFYQNIDSASEEDVRAFEEASEHYANSLKKKQEALATISEYETKLSAIFGKFDENSFDREDNVIEGSGGDQLSAKIAQLKQELQQIREISEVSAELGTSLSEEYDLNQVPIDCENAVLAFNRLEQATKEYDDARKEMDTDKAKDLFNNPETKASEEELQTALRTLEAGESYTKKLAGMEQAQERLKKTFASSPTIVKRLDEAFDKYSESLKEGTERTEKGETAAKNLQSILLGLYETVSNPNMNEEDLNDATKKLHEGNQGIATGEKAQGDHAKDLEAKKTLASVTELTGAIGQLAFAWNSFSSLGSIFTDEDLNGFEKAEQAIMNLTMTIPMVISAYSSLKEVKDANTLSTVANTLETKQANLANKADSLSTKTNTAAKEGNTAATKMNSLATTLNTAKTKLQAAGYLGAAGAATVAAGAVRGLSAAVNFLATGPGIALMAILGVGVTAFSAWQSSVEQAKQEQEELISSSNELTSTVKDSYSSLTSLYNNYLDTGEATDDFKDSLVSLAETLGIANAELYAATGNYEILKDKIDATTESTLAQNTALLQQQQIELSKEADIDYAYLEENTDIDVQGNYNTATGKFSGYSYSGSRGQLLGEIQKEAQDQEKIMEELEKKKQTSEYNNPENTEFAQQVDQDYAKAKAKYDNLSNLVNESSLTYLDNLSTIAENRVQQNLINGDYSGITDYQDLTKELLSDSNIQEEYDYQMAKGGQEAADAYLASLISTIAEYEDSDELTSVLSLETAQQAAQTKFANQAEKLGDDYGSAYSEFKDTLDNNENYQNLSSEGKIYLLGQLDYDGTKEEITEQLDELSDEDIAQINIRARASSVKESYSGALSAIAEDETLGQEQLEPLLSDATVEAFEAASGASDSLSDAFTLLTDNSFETQKAIIGVDEAAESIEHAFDANEIKKYSDEVSNLEEKIKSLDSTGMSGSTEEAKKELQELQDEYEDKAFEWTIDVTGDALDTANALTEAINDLNDAVGLIGENFTVEADDIAALADAFPGILENYTVTADGMIQLNESVAKSAMEAAGYDASSTAEANAAKLKSTAEYNNTLADSYEEQAQAMAAMAAGSVVTTEEVNKAKSDADAKLAEAQQSTFQEQDKASLQLAENESGYAESTGQAIADTTAQGASSAVSSLNTMSDQAATVANNMITNFNQVAQAIANAGSGQQTAAGLTGAGVSMSSSSGASVKATAVQAGDTITINGTDYTVGTSDGNLLAAQYAEEYQAKANALRSAANKLTASAAEMEASAKTASSSIANAGKSDSSSSSSSSGSDSSSNKDYIDELDDEIDLYEKINAHLDKLANEYDIVAAERDRLVGDDLAKTMSKEIELIQKQIYWNQEKLKVQQKVDLVQQKSALSSYGIKFDSDGYITNYASVWTKLYNQVDSARKKYNSSQSDSDKESYEALKEKFETFQDYISSYDTLQAEIVSTQKEIEDLKDSIEDLRIEAFRTSVEAAENIKDLQDRLIEFNAIFSGLQSDDPFRAMATSAQKLATYFDTATGSAKDYYNTIISSMKKEAAASTTSASKKKWLNAQIAEAQKALAAQGDQTLESYGTGYLDMQLTNLNAIIKEIEDFQKNGSSSIFGEDSADLYDVAQEIFESATEAMSDFEGEIDSLRDAILDAIDEIAEKMDERLDQYENITDELEHYASIIEMLHGDQSYEQLNQALAAQQANYQAQIKELQNSLSVWVELQDAMVEGSDEWKAVQEQIVDVQKELNDLIETSLENLQKQYENMTNSILDSWINSAIGTDLDWMSTEWELINRNADQYLDSTNAAYNIQKLQNQYLSMLDNTNDLHTQQKITQQMAEQLNYLREKEKLSEYDVAYAQAQLEILQKQIALEEAQANKSQLKLKRDSQGNYSYVYTANETDVASAQNDLLDAENNAYNLSKEQIKQTQDDSLSALQDAKNMLNQIWTDANLTLEEKTSRTQTIVSSLQEYLQGTSEQLSTAEVNIINDFIGMVEMLTDENKAGLEDVYQEIIDGNIDAFDQIDTRWSTSLTNWLQNLDEFNESTDNAFASLVNNAMDYQDDVDIISSLVQQDFNDMSEAIQDVVDKTNALSSSQADFINQLKSDAGVVQDYESTLQSYADKITDVNNQMSAYKEQVTKLQSQLTAKEQENATLSTQISNLTSSSSSSSSGSSSSGSDSSSKSTKNPKVGETFGYTGKYYYTSTGVTPLGSLFAGKANAIQIDSYSAKKYGGNGTNTGSYDVHIRSANYKKDGYSDLGWIKKSQLFDTGGLTPDWSGSGDPRAKDGKLAFLHSKELVLNTTDTQNILAAVEAVREVASRLSDSTLQTLASSFTSVSSVAREEKLKQDVNISAEFPNVKDSAEIEQALVSLVDKASQFAYRTN